MGFFLRPFLALMLFVFVLKSSFSNVNATKDLPVGGHRNSLWQIPSFPDFYNQWAQSKRFQIGDSIVFKYHVNNDSVVRVNTEEEYKSCDASKAVQSYNDGNTRITLDRSGPFYFISGDRGHCESGQKVVVIVLSVKVKPAPATAFSPAEGPGHYAPAPAPNRNGAGKAGFVGGLAVAAACTMLAFA